MRETRAWGRTVPLVAIVLAVTACAAEPGEDAEPTPTPSSPAATPDAVEMPDTPAGRQADWVLAELEADASTTSDEAIERFSAAFLAAAPVETLLPVFDQLRAAAPWTPIDLEGSDEALRVVLTSSAQDLAMDLAVDADGRISTLFFSEPPPPHDPATSWEGLVEDVEELGASTSLLVADVSSDGECVPRDGMPAGSSADEPLPIGSMVKLYVLGAVVDAVGRGDLDWTTPLTVTDDVRSLPSGRLQDEPTGTQVTVQEAAELMISISDNTATDLLVHAVGREQVERAVAEMAHHDPDALAPLPTTRELFWLGWGGGPELRERWAAADGAGRRALLAEAPAGPLAVDVASMGTTVVWPSGVDWFATASDLCAAHVALAERAGTPHGEPVTQIMSANPGVEVDGEEWPYVAFKGGSSVGTMGGSWYAEDDDGDALVVVLQTAATDVADAVPAETLVHVAEDAFRLAAED